MLRAYHVAFLALSIACSGTIDPIGDGGTSEEAGVNEDGSGDGAADGDLGDGDGDGDGQSDGDIGGDGSEAEPDAGGDGDGCTEGSDVQLDVVRVAVSGPNGAAPQKGDRLSVTLTIANAGTNGAAVGATVLLDGMRFDEFRAIPLGRADSTACPGETVITLEGGPFLADPATNKQFALGSGDYLVSAVQLETPSGTLADNSFEGAAFNLASNNVLLVPVLYNQGYFDELEGTYPSPEAYLEEAFRRRNEIFTPSGGDPDGDGSYQGFDGGFDEMMNVRHVFKSFIGFEGSFDSGENWCYGAMDYASQVLGLNHRWGGGGTRADQHGFDYVIALSSRMGGGVAWSPFDVQVSGFINRDVDRQQVIAVHESAHVFGAPHCDDVGNGEGGSLQGYVMCSGEKHGHYPQSFVFHATSMEHMSSRWN